MKPRLRALAAGISDVGLQRDHNEDNFVIVAASGPFVVADGMGGHRAGDVASRIAIDSISEYFCGSGAIEEATWPFHFDARLSENENRLLTGVRLANRRILERSARSREFHGMGTTVVSAMLDAGKSQVIIAHVGDSRAYRVRGGFITQMTRDHSLFNDYLAAMPDLSDEQRNELPRNVITRALGMQDDIAIDLQTDEARAGDVYVLCSDGLSGMVEDEELLELLAGDIDLTDACRALVRRANENGGEDNVTALLIRIETEDGSAPPEDDSPVDSLRTIPSGPMTGIDDTPAAAPVSSRR